MNTLLLKHEMKRFGDNDERLAKVLGIHPHTLYMKMREENRTQQFTQAEIKTISERYELSPETVIKIFFE